jgi:hypothetical protein
LTDSIDVVHKAGNSAAHVDWPMLLTKLFNEDILSLRQRHSFGLMSLEKLTHGHVFKIYIRRTVRLVPKDYLNDNV